MRSMVKAVSCLSLALTGCDHAPPVITKPVAVRVEKEVLVSLPPDILASCPNKPPPLATSASNGDLLWGYLGYSNSYTPCLEEKLESIRRLQPK